MKVIYGTSIPPDLQGPTRGELRLRVQAMSLHDSLVNGDGPAMAQEDFARGIQRPSPHIPVDHCSVQFRFWGESAPRASTTVMPRTAACADRPVYELVYAVKTLEPQLIQYLRHMSSSSQGGVAGDVFVTADVSGKKSTTMVGKVSLSLAALTSATAIFGWFNVVDHATKSRCIGRVQLHASVTFFDLLVSSPKKKPRQPLQVQEAAAKEEGPAVGVDGAPSVVPEAIVKEPVQPEQQLPTTGEKSNPKVAFVENAAAGKQPSAKKPHAAAGVATAAFPAAALTPGDVQPAPVNSNEKPSKAAASAAASSKDTAAQLLPQPGVGTDSTSKAHRDILLREIYARGLALRDKMVTSAGSTSDGGSSVALSGLPSALNSRSQGGFTGSSSSTATTTILRTVNDITLSLPANTTETAYSFAEHLHLAGLGSAADGAYGEADDGEGYNDAEDLVSASSDQDADGTAHPFPQGSYLARQQGPPQPVSFPGGMPVYVCLANISFSQMLLAAPTPVAEIRFGLRWSTDVNIGGSPINAVSSLVRRLPLLHDCAIKLLLDVRSCTTDSKLVLECYGVTSEPRKLPPPTTLLPPATPPPQERVVVRETLLGLAAVGLFGQSRELALHDPVSGANPIRLSLTVDMSTLTYALQLQQKQQAEADSNDAAFAAAATAETTTSARFELAAYTEGSNGVTAHASGKGTDGKVAKKRRGKKKKDRRSRSSSSSSSSSSSNASSLSSASSASSAGQQRGKAHADTHAPFPCGAHVVVFEPPLGATGSSTVTITQTPKLARPLTLAGPANGPGGTEASPSRVDSTLQPLQTRRVHVSILEAKSLPRSMRFLASSLDANLHGSTAAGSATTHYSWAVAAAESGAGASGAEARQATAGGGGPTSFFTVDELTVAASALTPSLDSTSSLGKRSAEATGASVGAWTVEAAVQGRHDRTNIVCNSTSPLYKYECILVVPTQQPLGQLQLQFWTVGDEAALRARRIPSPASNNSGTTEGSKSVDILSEDQIDDSRGEFWAACAATGTVAVDLTMLKYLPVVDGWQKIVSLAHAVPTVIGHVRVAVRVL